jgi:thiol-disulfide isomerase/thioredoxin
MEKKHAPVTKTPYMLLLLCVVAIALLSYLIISQPGPAQQECQQQNCTAAAMPKHNISEVVHLIGRVMDSYTDLAYAAPTTPKFLAGDNVWEESVVLNRSGSPLGVRIRVYDSNLTLQSIMVEGPKPLSLSEDEVVAQGVVRLNGKLNCSQDKIRAFVFFDLYCPPCLAAESKVAELKQKFNNSVSFEYKIIPTHSYDLVTKYGSNVTRALGYLLCARAQDKLDEMKNCTEDAYLKHQEVPLTENELTACVNKTSLNTSELDTCMSSYNVDMNRDWMLAETDGLVGTIQTIPAGAPVITVDCQYKAEPQYAEAAICYAHPELKECKQ